MQQVGWSQPALNDLRNIQAYLATRDPAVALRILQAIREKAAQLADFPALGPPLEGNLRYASVRNTHYVIVYRLKARRLDILRVRHAAEDWRPVQ